MKSKFYNTIVKKISKIVGIDLDYFIKGGFWTATPLFLESGINALMAILFANLVAPETYGEYRFFVTILLTLFIFSMPGISTAAIRSVAKKYDKSFLDATKFRFLFSLIGSLGLLVTGLYFQFFGTPKFYYYIAALFFPFIYSFRTYSDYLMGKEKYRNQAIFYSCQLIIANVLLVLSILTKNVFVIIITYLAAWAFSSLLLHKVVSIKYKKDIKKSKKDKNLLSYGINLTLVEVLPVLASNVDKILITYYLGFKTLAVYAIAQTISKQYSLSIKPLMRILLPKLSKQKDAWKTYVKIRSKIAYAILFSTAVCLAGIIVAPFIVNIFFPPDYKDAIIYSQLLFAGFIFALGSSVFHNYLTSQKNVKSLYIAKFYPSMLRIILLAVLLPFYGIYGAIGAIVLTNYYVFFQAFYLSRKEAKLWKKSAQ